MFWILIILAQVLFIAIVVVMRVSVALFVTRLADEHRYEGRPKTTVRRGRPIVTLRDAQRELDEFGVSGDVPDFLRPECPPWETTR